jgi:hypothetical protein
MTQRANARIAGLAFLIYIAAAFPTMIVFGKAAAGDDVTAQLAGIARHAADLRVVNVLSLVGCLCALVLGVTLYRLTREQDAELAIFALTCRVAEGVVGATGLLRIPALIWLATVSGADAPSPEGTRALGAYLLSSGGVGTLIGATFFAVGSTIFSWLMLRGRLIPAALAWIGVIASILLVIGLPLQMAGVAKASVVGYLWLPMALFEIPLGFWLIFKGVSTPAPRQAL